MTDQNPLLDTDWETRLRQEFMKQSWVDLQAFVADERSSFAVYPPDDEVFRALHLTSLADTQVVISAKTRITAPDKRTA